MIFVLDLDGTIIDSSKRHWVLLRELLEKYNIKIPQHIDSMYVEYKRSGKSTKDYLGMLDIDKKLVDLISKEWVEKIENERLINMDVLYDDAIYFLNSLYSKNNKIYYLSNRKNKDYLLNSLNKLDIRKYADEVIVTSPKSGHLDKTMFLKKIKHNDDNVIMIGDTEVDYKAASSVGIECFLLNRGFRNKEFWNSINVKSYDSLENILEAVI